MSDSTDTAGSTRPTDKAVHAWSLDGTLGRPRVPGPDGSGPSTAGGRAADALDLLDLPAELARRGYRAVQITHFQLPTRDAGYLAELRASLAASEITLDAFLVDDGDLTHPTDADRHERWISDLLDDAETLGAHHARVVAGRSAPTPELLASSARLRRGSPQITRASPSSPRTGASCCPTRTRCSRSWPTPSTCAS